MLAETVMRAHLRERARTWVGRCLTGHHNPRRARRCENENLLNSPDSEMATAGAVDTAHDTAQNSGYSEYKEVDECAKCLTIQPVRFWPL